MEKDFGRWHKLKESLDNRNEIPYFHEGEVWWVYLGINVGVETDGKGEYFSRPALILKKYNRHSFLSVPLSTKKSSNRYHLLIGTFENKRSYAILSQTRNLDSKRLMRKVGKVSDKQLGLTKRKISKVYFADFS